MCTFIFFITAIIIFTNICTYTCVYVFSYIQVAYSRWYRPRARIPVRSRQTERLYILPRPKRASPASISAAFERETLWSRYTSSDADSNDADARRRRTFSCSTFQRTPSAFSPGFHPPVARTTFPARNESTNGKPPYATGTHARVPGSHNEAASVRNIIANQSSLKSTITWAAYTRSSARARDARRHSVRGSRSGAIPRNVCAGQVRKGARRICEIINDRGKIL